MQSPPAKAFPAPKGGASLMLAFRPQRHVLIVGSNSLAASRAFSAVEADASVVVLAQDGLAAACEEIQWRAANGELAFVDIDTLPSPSADSTPDQDFHSFATYLDSIGGASLVCVTDTILGADSHARRSRTSAEQIYRICRERNIPVNITDMPEFCDFTFASTHRFIDPVTDEKTPLQVAVVTNGQGCRLSGRIRRDIVSKLPRDAGTAVEKVGQLRRLAKGSENDSDAIAEPTWNEEDRVSTPNRPVPQRSAAEKETELESARRRMKWVAQISEYWSYMRLAKMTDGDMHQVLHGDGLGTQTNDAKAPSGRAGDSHVPSIHSLSVPARVSSPSSPGRILLVGSGPGHPGLLTAATHNALTKHADLVLSDKLVPEAVLALIPSSVEIRIARKFPGNADGAQQEMMEAAVEAAKRGLTVVRVGSSPASSPRLLTSTLNQLKQGDPTVYGRAGEEVLYFRSHGFESVIVPGVSSALAGPIFAGIPVTQRGAAESFTVCTGVGRKGKQVKLPGYDRSRTLVILMGVARLDQVLETLQTEQYIGAEETRGSRRDGPAYPAHTPIAIIERASIPDQRVTTSTLAHIAAALESAGEQRPPGMIVVGWSILSLWKNGDINVLDDGAEREDEARIERWLGGERWRIVEGFDGGWEGL